MTVYGPGTALCNTFGFFKDYSPDGEFGVATGPHECANGGRGYDPIQRFTKGTAARNEAAAAMYLALRNEGKEHAEARSMTLEALPAR